MTKELSIFIDESGDLWFFFILMAIFQGKEKAEALTSALIWRLAPILVFNT